MYYQKTKQEERSLQRALALAYAKSYCHERGLSAERLESQKFDYLGGAGIFYQPTEAVPNGLTNDLETMPKPTLILRYRENGIQIEQTEYTSQYLA